MRTYTWDEYYDKFYDWAESTQVRNLSSLTSIGSADEVAEIIAELQFDESAANQLLKRAVDAKLKFSVLDLVEILGSCDEEYAMRAVYNSATILSEEDIEELYGLVDDEVIIEICNMRKFPLPDELVIDEYEDEIEEDACSQQKKPGFFTTLFAILGVEDCIDRINQTHKHDGRCNGDCANCPPHYGYRYGRWYYGHHHTHGCELGGGNS